MVGQNYTKLKLNTERITDPSISESILNNFVDFYDWGLLDAGGFYNITMPQSGIYGGDRHQMRMVDSKNYNVGQVWEGYRKNWVWEGSGNIDGVTEQPINISGVYIDGSFYDNANLTHPFYIDYPEGRVVFDNALPTSSVVELEYSHKRVSVIPAKGVSWFRQIQQNSFRNEKDFQVHGSGGWVQLGQSRIQLPALAIEVVPAQNTKPYQLGHGQWVNTDVIFYTITENHWECVNLVDTIVSQNDRSIMLYDTTQVAASGVSPFTFENGKERELRGHANPSGLYPNLVDNFRIDGGAGKCWITDTRGGDITQLSPDLYMGVTRCTTEVGPL